MKFRVISTLLLVVVLGFLYLAFDGAPPTSATAKPPEQEQPSGLSGLGK